MADHVPSALFIFSEEGREYVDRIGENPHGTTIESVSFETLLGNEKAYLQNCVHAVVSGPLTVIKTVMHLAMLHRFSLGFLPLPSQKLLSSSYGLPKDPAEAISLALRNDPQDLDIVFCNDDILLFRAIVGRIPLVDSPENSSKARIIINGFKRITSLHLLPFTVTTTGKNNVELSTAA